MTKLERIDKQIKEQIGDFSFTKIEESYKDFSIDQLKAGILKLKKEGKLEDPELTKMMDTFEAKNEKAFFKFLNKSFYC
jgi:HJR/Mrr/RecB family endonuclease